MLKQKGAYYFMLLSASLLAGCAGDGQLNRARDQVRIDVGKPFVEVRSEERGIFLVDTGIKIKHLAKPLPSFVDELIYRTGGGYTVLSDLSTITVSIFETDKSGKKIQKRFENRDAVLTYIAKQVNQSYSDQNLPYRLSLTLKSDGPVVSLMSVDGRLVCYLNDIEGLKPAASKMMQEKQDCQAMSFKKIFLQNVTSDEAAKSISTLFPGDVGSAAENTKIVEYTHKSEI